MTVFRIVKKRLGMQKIASRWVPWDLTEAQRWPRYDAVQTHLQRYGRDGDTFLRCIIALDETWAKSYKPFLSANPISGIITGHHTKHWCVVPLQMSK